jgi:acyl-coenzyme A synthetase/AMP-(fatty) acid ligase
MNNTFLIDEHIISYSELDGYINNTPLPDHLNDLEKSIILSIKRFVNKEQITLSTSGTSSTPKIITHTYNTLINNVKINDRYKNKVWGLCYNYEKMAAVQVILHSFFNKCTIVNLYGLDNKSLLNRFKQHNITNLSATPTFYKLLLSDENIFSNIEQITVGGEILDNQLYNKLKKYFPNSRISNIYAATEFGALLTSNGESFEITEKDSIFIKIVDNEILVHKSKLGISINEDWYHTGDIVDWINESQFKIIGRQSSMINVGGVKVNPIKVENIINSLDYVSNSRVYGYKNSLLGNVVKADIVLLKEKSIQDIKHDLKTKLNQYELPMSLKIVDSLDVNDSNKLIRK